MDFDEPDFSKHLRNVLQDCWDHTVEPYEAEQAIIEHPGFNAAGLKPIADLGEQDRRLDDA